MLCSRSSCSSFALKAKAAQTKLGIWGWRPLWGCKNGGTVSSPKTNIAKTDQCLLLCTPNDRPLLSLLALSSRCSAHSVDTLGEQWIGRDPRDRNLDTCFYGQQWQQNGDSSTQMISWDYCSRQFQSAVTSSLHRFDSWQVDRRGPESYHLLRLSWLEPHCGVL